MIYPYYKILYQPLPINNNNILKPWLISIYPWINVTLDFITRLILSNSYNGVLMVIDQLAKERYYIPYTTDKNSTTIKVTAYQLLNNIWKLYNLFLSLISNWDSIYSKSLGKSLYNSKY